MFDDCRWVLDRFPIGLEVVRAREELGGLGLAIRDNPKRAQLLVSRVLAKHVPVSAADAFRAACALAEEILLLGPLEDNALVLGLAETATGLAELVAAELPSVDFIHSTRMSTDSASGAAFAEAHSHAPDHRLAPAGPDFLRGRRTVVVVDDELTTASTVVNLLEAISGFSSIERVVVACLVDARVPGSDDPLAQFAQRRHAVVEVCSLATLSLTVGPCAGEFATDLVRTEQVREPERFLTGPLRIVEVPKPPNLPRYGTSRDELAERSSFSDSVATVIARRFGSRLAGADVHIVGIEEQIALPVRLAGALALGSAAKVLVSSTTRSPAVVVDEPGYPLRRVIRFGRGDGGRRLYNAPSGSSWVIVVPDEDGVVPSELLAQLPGERVVLQWLDSSS